MYYDLDSDTVIVKAQDVTLTFYIDAEVTDIGTSDGYEFGADCVNGLYVKVGKEVKALAALIDEINGCWDDLKDTAEHEALVEARHARVLSSPYLTGRI